MSNFEKTLNKYGNMFPLNNYKRAFIDYALKVSGPIIDIGAAFGIVTLPLLEKGANVIAIDLEQGHLDKIAELTPEKFRKNLTLKQGHFPNEIDFPENYTHAILCSLILHFLSPEDLILAAKKMYTWLKPGGKVFTLNRTPYHLFCQKFIPVYEQHLQQHELWPGYTEDCSPYVLEQGRVPNKLHLLDPDVMRRVFSEANFIIEEVGYTPFQEKIDPDTVTLDGREDVILTAMKPKIHSH